ncbi:MAG: DUF5687 family protein [Prevotella sp.]|nr:DUF5687 family protein [Prevotella sp.]
MAVNHIKSLKLSPLWEGWRGLRKHIRLSEKRSPIYERNRAAKVILSVLLVFAVGYLMFFSVGLAMIANEMDTCTPYEMIFGILPFLLLIDFLFRFGFQQTPAQQTKPYTLLPISKYACVEVFVVSAMFSSGNLIWLALTVPYSIMTIMFNEGFFAALGLVVSYQIMVIINSQWYMLVRTLINQSMKWWFLPLLLYVLLFSPLYFSNFDLLFDTFAYIGTAFTFWNPLAYICLLLVLWFFFEVNKRMQYHFVYLENANQESVKLRKVTGLRLLDRYGETGQYIKLEIKSLMRNKNLRKSFVFSTLVAVIYSLIIYTDLYENSFMQSFCIVFAFVIYGAMLLIKIMSAEGNYIDFLLVHKENIYSLLKAKYYLYVSLLLVPFLSLLATVFTGRESFLMLLSMMSFVAGPVYCLLMQMAVYNKQAIPLNTKLTAKGNMNNYSQIVVELLVMFVPIMFILILKSMFSEDIACLIILIIGMLFIVFHPLWIKNIHTRFMHRRYSNMDGFRATR